MLASSSKAALKRIRPRICCVASSGAQADTSSLFTHRRHNSTQTETPDDVSVPSPHLVASRKRLSRFKVGEKTQQTQTMTHGGLRKKLLIASNSGNYVKCLEIATELKNTGHKPDISTYTALMHAAEQGAWFDAWAILGDMQMNGIQPDVNIFNALLKTQMQSGLRQTQDILRKMREFGVAPNATTYDSVIRRYISAGCMELALQYYWAMEGQNLVPELRTTQILISFVAQSGYPRLALELGTWYERISVRRLEPEIWMDCLISSAKSLYAPGVVSCWQQAVHELRIKPTEGLCLAVLDTAARNGLPDLATDVIRVLKNLGITWQEYHFSPVVEAFCHKGDVKEALQMLEIMRNAKLKPLPETTLGLSDVLKDTDSLDSVWSIIDELRVGGASIDVTVIQAIIRASLKLGDLQRAIGAYKSLPEYGLTADLPVYNYLLQGCVQASHRELGDRLLADMKAASVEPDQDTYEAFISLCLSQEYYEDAFFYLEEAKAAGFYIPKYIYLMLIEKCIAHDDQRYRVALDEMKEVGHELPPIQEMLRRAAKRRPGNATSHLATIDGAAQQFIESGGVEGELELPKEYFR